MAKQFFVNWELWQKMTFVLACAIVVTIFIGLAKLKYDHYRIAKYTKIEKGKQTQTPQMLEAQPEETKEDVPFGVRAIESGIEVDGVWISRTNTPVGSSRSSITDIRLPRSHNGSQLELPQAVLASSSRNSSRPPSSFDLAVGAERVSNNSRSSSPGRNPEGRARPPVSINTRYSKNPATLQALEGAYAFGPSAGSSRDTSGKSSPRSSPRNSPRSSDEGSDYRAMDNSRPQPAYLSPQNLSLYPVDPRADLDLLQSHRMSHVAETGQLTPRVRKPVNSGEWATAGDNTRLPEEISTVNGVDYFVPQQKTPSPPPAPVATPSNAAPATDSQAATQAKQAVPLLESYAQRPYYLPETYQPRGPQHQFSYDEMSIEVNTAQNQQRDAHDPVLRKVNSGFEILRPGTLPTPEEEQAAPTEKRQSRRLQKKRRTSSAGSRTSHFIEQV